jgi:putative transposase
MYEYRKLSLEEREALVEERRARGFPLHAPPHPNQEAGCYLLTAACYEHRKHMVEQVRRRQVLDLLFEHSILRGIELRAWVVLPNHYHLLASVPDFTILSELFRRVHGATTRYWNQEEGTPGRRVWYRYTDRAIRSERHYCTTLNYIHYNPVKHGCVGLPYDWEESSVAWYLEHYGRDWLRDLWVSYPLRAYGEGWDEGL